MRFKSKLQKWLVLPVVGLILMLTGVFTPVIDVHAEPENQSTSETEVEESTENTENTENTEQPDENNDTNSEESQSTENTESTEKTDENAENTCYDQIEGIGWLVCPSTGVFANAIDSIYGIIENLLTVKPLTTDSDSPIYIVWQYARDITNIVFIIMLLVVVWSQLTGVGINNYGIKKVLPRLIIAAVMVNLSFIICSLAVDASNILGATLRGFFSTVQENAIASGGANISAGISWGDLVAGLIGGGTVAGLAIGLSGGIGAFLWMLIGAVIAGLLAVFVGLVTIALRQAVVFGLVMVAPLAFVCYLLPNTEKWFQKWKDALFSMLIFYPMFSALFGAAQLAGWALIASANGNAFWTILGMAVQVVPLFLSVSLMKMSSTVLGTVSNKLNNLAAKPSLAAKNWADSHREQHRQYHIANSVMPSASLRRYLDNRKHLRETDIENSSKIRAGNTEIYTQRKLGVGRNAAYDPGSDQKFRTTRYVRNAKLASNVELAAQTAAMDTKHILSEDYSSAHGKTGRDLKLSSNALRNFYEYNRAELAARNDDYADVDILINKYDKLRKFDTNSYAYKHFVTGAAGALSKQGNATVLGEVIEKAALAEAQRKKAINYTLGKYGYGGMNKVDFRDFFVGYHVNDNGIAVEIKNGVRQELELPKLDKNGKVVNGEDGKPIMITETFPGEFFYNRPEELAKHSAYSYKKAIEVKDPLTGKVTKDPYFDVRDPEGNFVTRIYKSDGPAMKEILANHDIPIGDPINGLYMTLSGVDPKDYEKYGFTSTGLKRFRTTIAGNIGPYKEKAPAVGSSMAAALAESGGISNYAHLNLARMDNFVKTVKPGALNRTDSAEWKIDAALVDPKNWEQAFYPDEKALRTAFTVNHMPLKGTRIKTDKNGKPLFNEKGEILRDTVYGKDITFEDLKNTVILDYIIPGTENLIAMMSRISPAVADDLKPGVVKSRHKLYENVQSWMSEENLEKYPILRDPLARRTTDAIRDAREIRQHLYDVNYTSKKGGDYKNPNLGGNGETANRDPRKKDQAKTEVEIDREYARRRREGAYEPNSLFPDSRNHLVHIDEFANTYYDDPDGFYEASMDYLERHSSEDSRLRFVIDEFENIYMDHGSAYTTEQYHLDLEDLIISHTYNG